MDEKLTVFRTDVASVGWDGCGRTSVGRVDGDKGRNESSEAHFEDKLRL